MNNKVKSIQVFGSNCPTCKKFYELVKLAARELNIDAEVEYSSDIQKMLDTGMMSSPVLVVNGKAIISGRVPSIEKIKGLLDASGKEFESRHNKCACSCHKIC